MQLLVDESLSGAAAIIDTTIGKSETWAWDHGALSKGSSSQGLCIVSWKNTKTEDYLVLMVVVFLVFPSLSEIAHRGKDGTE